MAMTREAVAEVQSLASELTGYAQSDARAGINALGMSAGSFAEYLNKTEGGQDFLEKYIQLTKILEDYFEQVNEISNAVNDLVSNQESINA